PEVEADVRVVVDDPNDAIARIEDARIGVGRVALRRDPLVPVVIRRRGILVLDGLEPAILPRRLVEMSVDADESIHPRQRVSRTALYGRSVMTPAVVTGRTSPGPSHCGAAESNRMRHSSGPA